MGREIDVMQLGRAGVICAHEVDGMIVDPGPASRVDTLLDALGEEVPRALLLTHIHLDHAGAAGTLARRFPDMPVYVHERGAPHLVDPGKLLASAARLYGDRMGELWGETEPVPEAQVRVLSGGEVVEGMRVLYTPGHAQHHVCYLREETGDAYVGDMAGVRPPEGTFTLAPTPPPDIDVERWLESVDSIERWDAATLRITHFGTVDDVGAQLGRIREALRFQAELVRRAGEDEFVAAIQARLREELGEARAETMAIASPPHQLHAGLTRYWRKREEAEAA